MLVLHAVRGRLTDGRGNRKSSLPFEVILTVTELFEDFDDISDLAEGLDDPSPGARIMAVIELADSADPAAIPHLARAITDVDAGVRKQAAQALTDFDGPDKVASAPPKMVNPNQTEEAKMAQPPQMA